MFIEINETPEMQHSIDNMSETLLQAMHDCVDDKREMDAVSIYEEWIVDGQDPEDGEYEFTFIPNFTLESN
ncbi:hypothetical protein [Synechococcus phage S-H35]|uniref:Uncharacterized protein n=1 Tax=Synechococcus phage S-H35 TaxID=1983572 RepID=A0A1Z1LW77_9CAUD|nr:hypothetical protein KNT63_gp025 [Synechococcus phage S-H35]ARW56906.1 hypothetical protein [Synechococcus phage S-H35]QBQ74943.1 hypothetical protein RW110999_065 [Cyanophage S-RIM4]